MGAAALRPLESRYAGMFRRPVPRSLALEVLSQRFGAPASNWDQWEQSSAFDKLFNDLGITETQREALQAKMMRDRHIRLKATFQDYVALNVPDSFWTEPYEQWMYAMHLPQGVWGEPTPAKTFRLESVLVRDRAVLRQVAGAAYNVRSRHVHRGDDVLFSQAGLREDVMVTGDEPPPYALVRAILVTLLRSHLAAGE